MSTREFLIYIAVMAGVTYLIRMLPMVLLRQKIHSQFVKSFLFYVPYAVLAAMTVPAIFESTGSFVSALAGFLVAAALAWMGGNLLAVALVACAAVYLVEWLQGIWR
ncbi:AzlD domain-containing protein [uncultured Ruthenibacterium sp.]|uniref:AzlD domain-containing protein n=1 Tax=uncultured Ruthenibacterium sp. TaxID=1905347 RepID=UPI00349EC4A0